MASAFQHCQRRVAVEASSSAVQHDDVQHRVDHREHMHRQRRMAVESPNSESSVVHHVVQHRVVHHQHASRQRRVAASEHRLAA